MNIAKRIAQSLTPGDSSYGVPHKFSPLGEEAKQSGAHEIEALIRDLAVIAGATELKHDPAWKQTERLLYKAVDALRGRLGN